MTTRRSPAVAKKRPAPAGTGAVAKKPPAAAKKSPAAAKKPPTAAKKPPAAAGPGPGAAKAAATVHGSQAAFERYLPLARALPAEQVAPLSFDPELGHFNIRVGVDALTAHRPQLARELPSLDLDHLLALGELGQAVLFATRQAEQQPDAAPDAPNLRALLREGQKLRSQLLSAADTLAAFDQLPQSAVDKIRQGRGNIDSARDLSDLAALYHQHSAKFQQQTPVTPAQVQRAAEVGAALLALLRPDAARRRSAPPPSTATTDRDRLATLLVQGHRDLRRAGFWLWTDDVDTHVPPLRSNRRRPTKKPAAPPAPVA